MEFKGATLLIFDNELSPTQSRNIAKNFKIDVTDRTEIILDIFHEHAKTKEAKLQVRLAELKYQLPRLKKLWCHLDRERGASGGSGGASRGMGEKQIEIDRRLIKDEIIKTSEFLEKVLQTKDTQRKLRKDIEKICIVGYTNAGKSTLFNKLTGADVLVADKLFATLDSTAKKLFLTPKKQVIISDTVGFISNLPHHLVASFKATLTDLVDADLLFHVVDVADERCEDYIKEVNNVIASVTDREIPSIIVFNKIDKLENERMKETMFSEKYKKSIGVSAITGENMDKLLDKALNFLFSTVKCKLLIPHDEQKLIATIFAKHEIISKKYLQKGIKIEAVIEKEQLYLYEKYITGKQDI